MGGGESPAHEGNAHHQIRQAEKQHAERGAEGQGDRQGAVLRPRRADGVAGGQAAAHFGQQHGASRDADDADRQLIQPIGENDRRLATIGKGGGNDRIGEDRDLDPRRGDDIGAQHGEKTPEIAAPARFCQGFQHARAPRRDHDQAQLQEAGHQDTDAGGNAGIGKQESEAKAGHHRQVEQHRGKSRGGKMPVGIQRRRVQRHQHDAGEIGKGDARHRLGKLEFFRIAFIARCQQVDDLRHEQPGKSQQHKLRGQQQRENLR